MSFKTKRFVEFNFVVSTEELGRCLIDELGQVVKHLQLLDNEGLKSITKRSLSGSLRLEKSGVGLTLSFCEEKQTETSKIMATFCEETETSKLASSLSFFASELKALQEKYFSLVSGTIEGKFVLAGPESPGPVEQAIAELPRLPEELQEEQEIDMSRFPNWNGSQKDLKTLLATPWENKMEVTVRTYNRFKDNNIRTIGDVVKKTEGQLLNIKHFGHKSLNEVKGCLEQVGLNLKS